MRVVYMELKFDPKYKSAVFLAKYLKSEIVLGDFLFNGRCDLVSKPVRDKTAD